MFQLNMESKSGIKPYFVNVLVKIEQVQVKMELDSGAGISILTLKLFKTHWANLKVYPNLLKLKTYNGKVIDLFEEVFVNIEYKDEQELFVSC